jgi:hypothetical protein
MGFHGMHGVWEAVLPHHPKYETAGAKAGTEEILFGLPEAVRA